jgi:hypothetical protein
MDFSYSPRTQELQAKLNAFMAEHVYPVKAAGGPRSRPIPRPANAGRRCR